MIKLKNIPTKTPLLWFRFVRQ